MYYVPPYWKPKIEIHNDLLVRRTREIKIESKKAMHFGSWQEESDSQLEQTFLGLFVIVGQATSDVWKLWCREKWKCKFFDRDKVWLTAVLRD
jgi:hypothetical protein